jgi:hypothetical protein
VARAKAKIDVDVGAFFLEPNVRRWPAKDNRSLLRSARMFFRHRRIRGWSESEFAEIFTNPRIPKVRRGPKGPPWNDVRRSLETDVGHTAP